jgi:hypothetical protein
MCGIIKEEENEPQAFRLATLPVPAFASSINSLVGRAIRSVSDSQAVQPEWV